MISSGAGFGVSWDSLAWMIMAKSWFWSGAAAEEMTRVTATAAMMAKRMRPWSRTAEAALRVLM